MAHRLSFRHREILADIIRKNKKGIEAGKIMKSDIVKLALSQTVQANYNHIGYMANILGIKFRTCRTNSIVGQYGDAINIIAREIMALRREEKMTHQFNELYERLCL